MDYGELKHSDLGKAFVDGFADTVVDHGLELYHHGIKGMKWGVRRYQNSDGSLTGAGRKRYTSLKKRVSKAVIKAKKLRAKRKAEKAAVKASKNTGSKKKTIGDMSDAELKEKINRLQLEKQYRDYMRDLHPDKKAKGAAFVNEVLEKSVKNIASQTATYVLGAAVNKVAKNAFGIDEMINPKKGQKDK